MRLHRFYTNLPLIDKTITISEERLINQWENVFRMSKGDKVILFDGGGKEYIGELKDLNKEEAIIEILEEKEGIVPERKITLYQSLIKKDKMEWVVEKATELGASRIVPVISERSEKKGFNLERARKIAIEAAEQCGRADVPIIGEIVGLEEVLKGGVENGVVFDPSGSSFSSLLSNVYNLSSIFIGPEGGWTDKEIERFKEVKMEIFSLGKLVLRAETAAIAALTISTLPN